MVDRIGTLRRRRNAGFVRQRSVAHSGTIGALANCGTGDGGVMTKLTGWRRGDSQEALVMREWLVTNALGGYATGTIGGIATRRFHGALIAALPAPLGRVVMLNHLEERVVVRGESRPLSGDEPLGGTIRFPDLTLLEEFRLERGLPVWIFNDAGVRITKRLV